MQKAINAVILRNKEILLFRKNSTWILPGGKPNPRESDFDALARQFREEASNAEIIVWDYYGRFTGITPHTKKVLESIVYFAKLKKQDSKLIPSGEINKINFVNYSNSRNLNVSDITNEVIMNLAKRGYL